MGAPPPLLSFRLAQLLAFYLYTVETLLGPSSQLAGGAHGGRGGARWDLKGRGREGRREEDSACSSPRHHHHLHILSHNPLPLAPDVLRACRAMALRTFTEALRQRGDKLVRYPPAPPRDLSPPQQVQEGAQLVADLIQCHEQSYDPQQQQQQAEGEAEFSGEARGARRAAPAALVAARTLSTPRPQHTCAHPSPPPLDPPPAPARRAGRGAHTPAGHVRAQQRGTQPRGVLTVSAPGLGVDCAAPGPICPPPHPAQQFLKCPSHSPSLPPIACARTHTQRGRGRAPRPHRPAGLPNELSLRAGGAPGGPPLRPGAGQGAAVSGCARVCVFVRLCGGVGRRAVVCPPHPCPPTPSTRLRSEQLEEHVAALVITEVARTLARCGVAELSERVRLWQAARPVADGAPMAADPALALPRVADAMRTFFGRLSDPAALPEFPRLQVSPSFTCSARVRCSPSSLPPTHTPLLPPIHPHTPSSHTDPGAARQGRGDAAGAHRAGRLVCGSARGTAGPSQRLPARRGGGGGEAHPRPGAHTAGRGVSGWRRLVTRRSRRCTRSSEQRQVGYCRRALQRAARAGGSPPPGAATTST